MNRKTPRHLILLRLEIIQTQPKVPEQRVPQILHLIQHLSLHLFPFPLHHRLQSPRLVPRRRVPRRQRARPLPILQRPLLVPERLPRARPSRVRLRVRPIDRDRLDYTAGDSVYGGGVVGQQITGGVSLAGDLAEQSFYALNNGYSSPTSSAAITCTVLASGTVGGLTGTGVGDDVDRWVRFDPDLEGKVVAVGQFPLSDITPTNDQFNMKDLVTVTLFDGAVRMTGTVRRLTREADANDVAGGAAAGSIIVVMEGATQDGAKTTVDTLVDTASFVIDDNLTTGGALGSVVGANTWGLEGSSQIPEIDIKVDSVAVTAKTKKLKAKWTPELAQDLNAYHNLDAEVELTSILSEHIALEIDQEILEDLIKGATAGKLYWSRLPGKFLTRTTGAALNPVTSGYPDFTGNVSEWYETLVETINDVSAQIHRKTLRGGANFIVCSPEVANLLEFTAGFRGSVTHDADRGQVGAVRVGSLSKKFEVYVDPYFPRNVVLCGRKGTSFLESGYVYAPYVPLQMTPTIFGTEDFVPRKGVMTRYAKKMVRPDMYGLVIVEDLS